MADIRQTLVEHLHGRYSVGRQVARGRTSSVFIARDLRHARHVAIKVLLPDIASTIDRERLHREIGLASRLDHPGVATVLDADEAEGLLFVVSAYVNGESLRDRLDRDGPLSLDETVSIVQQVADALAAAHREGVIHRDLRPEHILLVRRRVVVTNFGMVRPPRPLEYGYLSPEQAAGDPMIDGRTDLYALGCVFYEMLIGELPFGRANTPGNLASVIEERAPSLRIVRPDVPVGIEAIICRLLAPAASDRYAVAEDLVAALPVCVLPLSDGVDRVPRRWPWVAAALGVAVLGIAVGRLVTPTPVVDRTRIVVFPLSVLDATGGSALGEDGATAVLTVLGSAASLRVIDGWHPSEDGEVDVGARASLRRQRDRARRLGAGLFISGRVGWVRDSILVRLELHELASDSTLGGASGVAAADDVWHAALRAVMGLPNAGSVSGEPMLISHLGARPATAIDHYLAGARAERRGELTDALAGFAAAVAADSAFARSAVRGLQVAIRLHEMETAAGLAEVAATRDDVLPRRLAWLARAFREYARGDPDSSVAHYRRAIALDGGWADAYAGLAEVYTHRLPHVGGPIDSLARASFERARALGADGFAAQFHLFEIAVRRGDLPMVRALASALIATDPEAWLRQQIELTEACVTDGPASIDWWDESVAADVRRTVLNPINQAAKTWSGRAGQLGCAEAAWRMLIGRSSSENVRWAALNGLHNLLLAQGRFDEAQRLVGEVRSDLPLADVLNVVAAELGVPTDSARAAARVAEFGRDFATMRASTLAVIGMWATRWSDVATLDEIAAELSDRYARDAAPNDSVLARSFAARAALARHDTSAALDHLAGLTAVETAAYGWGLHEALPFEQMTRARLLLASGRPGRAMAVAERFDSPEPIAFLRFLPQSLALRAAAAEMLGQSNRARVFRQRLQALSAAGRIEH